MLLSTIAAGLAIGLLVGDLPSPAIAQPPAKTYRLGYLEASWTPSPGFPVTLFKFSLPELGWVEGQNFVLESRGAGGRDERLDEFAGQLVRARVDVILADGVPAADAARRATKTIPIVIVVGGDPVAAGLVTSLGRPGANVTGVTWLSTELASKRLELLREIAPRASRIGVVWNAGNPEKQAEWRATSEAARALGLSVQSIEIRNEPAPSSALENGIRSGVTAMIVLADRLTLNHALAILDLAKQRRVPVLYGSRYFVESGYLQDRRGLASYAADDYDIAAAAARQIDRIFKGAKPADLPVEQPTRFELIISVKTADALGLTIPPSILARADRILQ